MAITILLFFIWLTSISFFFYAYYLRYAGVSDTANNTRAIMKKRYARISKVGNVTLIVFLIYLVLLKVILGLSFNSYYFEYIYVVISIFILDYFIISIDYKALDKDISFDFLLLPSAFIHRVYSWLRIAYVFYTVILFCFCLFFVKTIFALHIGRLDIDYFINYVRPLDNRLPKNKLEFLLYSKGVVRSESLFNGEISLTYVSDDGNLGSSTAVVNSRRLYFFKKPLFKISLSHLNDIRLNLKQDSIFFNNDNSKYITRHENGFVYRVYTRKNHRNYDRDRHPRSLMSEEPDMYKLKTEYIFH